MTKQLIFMFVVVNSLSACDMSPGDDLFGNIKTSDDCYLRFVSNAENREAAIISKGACDRKFSSEHAGYKSVVDSYIGDLPKTESKWVDMVNNKRYQNASTDEKKLIKNAYFDRYVAPSLNENKIDDAKAYWKQKTESIEAILLNRINENVG